MSAAILLSWVPSTQVVFGDSIGDFVVVCVDGVCMGMLGLGMPYEDIAVALSGMRTGGYGFRLPETAMVFNVRLLVVPFWLPFVIFGSLSAALFCWRREEASPQGCRSCGYNLTGNVSGVCPECGTKISDGPAASETPPKEVG